MSGMRYANTKFLIVTRYPLLQGLEQLVPSLCLRYAFAMAPLFLRSCDYRMNGHTTDLQRT